MSRSALVLGGGLAGMAAALRLAEAGVRVTLVETRKRLGGRASSFEDNQTGEHLDNCQHVLLGCCTNLTDFYRRLGVEDQIDWAHQLHFFDKQGHHDVLDRDDLPAPLHLSAAMMDFQTLRLIDKLTIGRAMLAIARLGVEGRNATADQTFADWLRAHGQTRRAIERFWAVIVVSALNQTPERLNAAYAIQVFQEGFLAHPDAYAMGTSKVPLLDLYDRAREALEASGGSVRLRTSVERIEFDGQAVRGVTLGNGETLTADDYLSALPFDRLAKVSPPDLIKADSRLHHLGDLTVSPILGIHLWFDQQVTHLPHLIFVDSPLQWIFNKGCDKVSGQQYLHGVISAADAWVDRSSDEIVRMAVEELAAYLPIVRRIPLVRGRAIKEKQATFSPIPDVDALRPGATGAVRNLFLAGDWCASGWPATMEGAVRSGYLAAGAVLDKNLLIDDLPPSAINRWLAGLGQGRGKVASSA